MVKKFGVGGKTSIQADVIVLGCTLPGIVAAHKLKSKFGDSMDIMVIDLPGPDSKPVSKCNVAFTNMMDSDYDNEDSSYDLTARQLLDNVARFYLIKYAKEFKLPLPDCIIYPDLAEENSELMAHSGYLMRSHHAADVIPEEPGEEVPLQKLFQYPDGNTVEFLNNVHDFEYLSFLEKFELNQYQTFLDRCMTDLFQTSRVNIEEERKTLLYYDRTTMEKNICETLLFSNTREIMRIIVRLVCGAPANSVSLLFYLHQCYRTSSAKNHLGGLNTRFREKLLGQCRKRLSSKLNQSIADITLQSMSIKGIRTYAEQVILETIKGETTYVCNLLAMALRPEQLHNIQVEDRLLSEEFARITKEMKPGYAKKFNILYRENFWTRLGYSGDIFSMRGPIIWAMQKPKLSTTGSLEKYSGLIGYLMVRDDGQDSKEAVIEQLVNMFGPEAAFPASYRETPVADVYVPRCGDYVALRELTTVGSPKFLEWAALDIFADGDVAAALEAGHSAYLHLLGCLRPQAQTYDDIIATDWPIFISESPLQRWISQINVITGIKITAVTTAVLIGVSLLRYMKNRI
ncbi:uncharacterized protein Shps [Helicoverpa armigera]|uniref:Amine oxidase domain-containing protein n=1 Tax=Helicoverpa armigera TaxID=29058 RepID=A0A2W1BMD8_HELAM|nr:hypothetical protein B5X24_HaOG207158 [Helicoverpa armigera]